MRSNRRRFLKLSGAAGLAAGAAACTGSQPEAQSASPQSPLSALRPEKGGRQKVEPFRRPAF
jgi:hypothetical protein